MVTASLINKSVTSELVILIPFALEYPLPNGVPFTGISDSGIPLTQSFTCSTLSNCVNVCVTDSIIFNSSAGEYSLNSSDKSTIIVPSSSRFNPNISVPAGSTARKPLGIISVTGPSTTKYSSTCVATSFESSKGSSIICDATMPFASIRYNSLATVSDPISEVYSSCIVSCTPSPSSFTGSAFSGGSISTDDCSPSKHAARSNNEQQTPSNSNTL